MPEIRLVPDFTFTAERLEELKEVAPEAFADGKVNWEVLRAAIGDNIEAEDAAAEHFGLFWPGKREARRLATIPSRGTLLPAPGEGVNEELTRNLFIEGDNLEVLKLLQKSYAGLVKMIYIDPPYNTGGDVVYRDDFADPLGEYLRQTGQSDETGVLTTNTRADGRFHSNWLSMMYPRLRLARNLLRDDGILFVSIDDRECANLRLLLTDVFGEENFLGVLVWHSKRGGGGDVKTIVAEHEYILAYSKTNPEDAVGRQTVDAQPLDLKDELGPYRKGRELNKWGAGSARADRPTMFFPIPGPNGEEVYPIRNDGSEGRWRLGKPAMLRIVSEGNALFEKRADGTYIVYGKIRSAEPRGKAYRTILATAGSAAEGTAALKDLFGGKSPFAFPKPPALLRKLFEIASVEDDDIVLDFFAGSGTTAHALLEKNRASEATLRFILVQLQEPTTDEYRNVAEIAKERVRRLIKKLRKDAKPRPNEDLGFRVYKLAGSHFRAWEAYTGGDPVQLQILFDEAQAPLVKGWTQEGVLAEVMLLEGFPLDSTVALEGISDNRIRVVTSDHCSHRLLICLDKQLRDTAVDGLVFESEDVLVCLDEALSDQAKQRLTDRCTLKTI